MNSDNILHPIQQLIAQGHLDKALAQLQTLLEHSPLLNEVIQQAGRFADIHRQIRLGTVSHADATLTKNQIQAGLLDLLQEIETQQGLQPAIQAEVARAAGKTIIQHADKIYNIDHIDNANFS